MPAVPRALAVVTCLLSTTALGGVAAPALAAPVSTDGLRARPAQAAPAARRAALRTVASAAQAPAADPRLDEQWALDGDGPMGIASAWRQTTGGDVTVAIVDSGIDLEHPDLRANLWTNPGEIPDNGIDDDGNGYVDDVHGYDFVDNDPVPQDEDGHGTHVAGIVAARGGNGIGVAGTAWRAQLMAVRVLDAQARGTTTTVAQGIRYAVANGARIINLSLAGPGSTPDLAAAVADAQARGVLVVAAAGNDGQDLGAHPTYPAAYPEPDVLGVAATKEGGALADVSDFGAGADLSAPGDTILSTALGGGYEWRTGTSMAAPAVSGALVLLAAARPDLSGPELRDALVGSARNAGLPVEDGALDVGTALRRIVPAAAWQDGPAPAATTASAAAAKSKTTAHPARASSHGGRSRGTVARRRAARARARARARAAARRRAALARRRAAR